MKLIGALVGFLIRWVRSGKRVTSNGYVVITSVSGEEKLEHRVVAERVLGRTLEREEAVHHINGRPGENTPDNLCVMPHLDHGRFHDWLEGFVKTNGGYPKRETQLRKLKEDFNGIVLSDIRTKWFWRG